MNVIWIVSDTLRRDHIGAYGNQDIRTPSLDDLAAKSARFDRCYAASFPTMPARADHATGRWTMSFMAWEPLPAGEVTLSQVLSKAGFHTAAFVDTPFCLRGNMNYDRGFQTFIEIPGQATLRAERKDVVAAWRFESDRFAPQTVIKATQWLERHYKEDFFLYVDVWDPHEPWDAPSYYTEIYRPGYDGEVIEPAYGRWQDTPSFTEETVKKAHACYCGEVTMVDTWIGYLLRQLENMSLMEKTAVIFTTDHGFYFGEHGGLFGKMSYARRPSGTLYRMGEPNAAWTHSPLYEEVAAIPLLIYAPNIHPGACSGLVSAVDLMPTVLDILGQEIPTTVEGESLLPMTQDSSITGRKYVISALPFTNRDETVGFVNDWNTRMDMDSTTTVTTDEWSLIYAVEPGLSELYHLPSDPRQQKNVIAQRPEIAHELHQLFLNFMQRMMK